jgi:hypothetical protein
MANSFDTTNRYLITMKDGPTPKVLVMKPIAGELTVDEAINAIAYLTTFAELCGASPKEIVEAVQAVQDT